MAELIGLPRIERLQDILDIGNTTWAGAEINFHVEPSPGDTWSPDFSAGCVIDGEKALVPEAINQQRGWDKQAESSFYCYAPVGYLRDGARMTLLVHPRDSKGRVTDAVVWHGEFIVRLEEGEYRLQQIISLSTGTKAELESLPGVGPKTAEAIMAYRQVNGPFSTVDQLDHVPMVGRHLIEALQELVRP